MDTKAKAHYPKRDNLGESMESSPQQAMPPEKKDLENYAIFYLGSYMNTVKKERPEHLPPLARNGPYHIEVCILPNGCLALIFTEAEKERVEVFERGWEYVESKVATNPIHLITVYPHEKSAVADAIARGKKDAARDIRSVEDSDIARAVLQLEKIMDTLKGLEQGNKTTLKAARAELVKMKPIWEAVRNAGPEVDMLALVDAMKSYPPAPITISVDVKDRELLEKTAAGLGDMSDLLRRLETQDRKLEDLEQSMRKVFSEYSRTIDERISKGLEVVLESETKKRLEESATLVQKVATQLEPRLSNLEQKAAAQPEPSPSALVQKVATLLEPRLSNLEQKVAAQLEPRPSDLEQKVTALLEPRLSKLESVAHQDKDNGVAKEVLLAVADIRANLDHISSRVSKLESTAGFGPKLRTLKKAP